MKGPITAALLVAVGACSGGSGSGATSAAPTAAETIPAPDANAPIILRALNSDGSVRWQTHADAETTSVDYAAVFAGKVAADTDPDCSGESIPVAWDLASGERQPAASDSPVIVPSDTDAVLAGYPEDEYAILDAKTGAERWRTTKHPVAPPTDGVLLVIGDDPSTLEALDLSTGTHRWDAKVTPSFVAVDGHRAFVSGTDGLTAVSLADGSILWQAAVSPGSDRTTVEVGGGLVFGQPAGGTGAVAVDGATGKVVWTAEGVSVPQQGEGLPFYGDGNLYVSGSSGISALDAKTGAVRWTTEQVGIPAGSFRQRGAIPGAFVLGVSSPTQAIAALDSGTGAVRWRLSDPDADRMKVYVGDDTILLATPCTEGP
jgi:outer membrane protein assembly factor BamB